MAFEIKVTLEVNVDDQYEIRMTDTWGTKVVTLSRRETREKAEQAIKAQKKT